MARSEPSPRLTTWCLLLCCSAAAYGQVCVDNNDCSSGDECIAGLCVAPVTDIFAYAQEAVLRDSSYIRKIQLPALFDPPEKCCFDLVGDSQLDDALGALLAILEPLGFDFQAQITARVEAGEAVKIVDWLQLPAGLGDGPVQFSVFDGFWTDGLDYATMASGNGSAGLNPESFGDYGAHDQFNTGSLSSGVATALGNQIAIAVAPFSIGEQWRLLPLRDPVVELPLVDSPTGCLGICTQDLTVPGQDPVDVGGGRLGGYLTGQDSLTAIDEAYRGCACAGIDPDLPVIEFGPVGPAYEIQCTDNTGDPSQCTGQGEEFCAGLTDFCSFAGLLPQTMDADFEEVDGINDSWTAGLRLSFSGTQVTGIAGYVFADGFESGDTSAWSTTVP